MKLSVFPFATIPSAFAMALAMVIALSSSAVFAADEKKPDQPEAEQKAKAADADAGASVAEEAESDGAFDRSRGTISLSGKDGNYDEGSHFAKWNWSIEVPRWGMYNVNLLYTSTSPKIGVQAKVGQFPALKSYLPRTGGDTKQQSLELGRVYIDKPGKYPLFLLTGDKSNGPAVFVRGVELVPSPETSPTHQSDKSNIITRPHSGEVGQSIDGDIVLPAGSATTWSELMRYEPKEEKNCLGYWHDIEDWAEWSFKVHSPGRYKIEIVQGCGEGQGGSKVAINIGSEEFEYKVIDTGGFQNWKTVEVGEIDLNEGTHQLAIKPIEKAAKAVFDVQKVRLAPVK
jgi:hypothetical protein